MVKQCSNDGNDGDITGIVTLTLQRRQQSSDVSNEDDNIWIGDDDVATLAIECWCY